MAEFHGLRNIWFRVWGLHSPGSFILPGISAIAVQVLGGIMVSQPPAILNITSGVAVEVISSYITGDSQGSE